MTFLVVIALLAVAAALLAGAVALMIFSAMQTDAQGKLAATQ